MVTVVSRLAPSLKVTVPEGVPLYAGLIVAVNVTVVPRPEGLSDDCSNVLLFARFTVTTDAVDVLGL